MRCPSCGEEIDFVECRYLVLYQIVDVIHEDGSVEEEVDKEFVELYDERICCPLCGADLGFDTNRPIEEQMKERR